MNGVLSHDSALQSSFGRAGDTLDLLIISPPLTLCHMYRAMDASYETNRSKITHYTGNVRQRLSMAGCNIGIPRGFVCCYGQHLAVCSGGHAMIVVHYNTINLYRLKQQHVR